MADLVDQADSWAYCDSQGVAEVREFLANEVNRWDGVRVSADDIIFFNGLGDAVAKVYGFLPDLTDIRNKVKHNDSIAGILLLSPDNPMGAVYPRELLEEIASIAREHDVFIQAVRRPPDGRDQHRRSAADGLSVCPPRVPLAIDQCVASAG